MNASTSRSAALLLIVAAPLVAYANALGNAFVFDDLLVVVGNKWVEYDVPLLDVLGSGYRPLRDLSYRLDRAIAGGLDPFVFRLSNVLWHVLACLAAYWVLLGLPRRAGERAGLTLPIAAAAALAFALHPVQTDSVAYVAGRRDVLVGLFYLLAFGAFVRWRSGGPRWLAVASLVAFGTAFQSKEMAASFPIVCGLYDLWYERRGIGGLLRRWPFHVVTVAVTGALTLSYVGRGASHAVDVSGGSGVDISWWGGSVLNNALTSITLAAHYTKLLVWPHTLIADYDNWHVVERLADPVLFASVAVLLVATALAWACRRRAPLVTFGVGWVYVTLLPVMHIIPHHELVAEHYLYLPVFGFVMAVAGGLDWLWRVTDGRTEGERQRRMATIVVAALLLVYLGRVVVRNGDWANGYRLARVTLADHPRCSRQNSTLANHLRRMGFLVEAEAAAERALALRSYSVNPHNTLGAIYSRLGRFDDALQKYEMAWRIKQHGYLFFMNLGGLNHHLGNLDAARAAFEAILKEERWYKAAYVPLAQVLKDLGELNNAEALLRSGLRRWPGDPGMLSLLANCLDRQLKLDEAEMLYRTLAAAGVAPTANERNAAIVATAQKTLAEAEAASDEAERRHAMARAKLSLSDLDGAREDLAVVTALPGASVDALRDHGGIETALGNHDAAAALFARGLELAPEDKGLRWLRADALAAGLRYAAAATAYDAAATVADAERVEHLRKRAELMREQAATAAKARAALTEDPNDPRGSLLLGKLYLADEPEAYRDIGRRHLRTATADPALRAEAEARLARSYQASEQPYEAAQAWRRAAAAAPSPAAAQTYLSGLLNLYLDQVKDFDRAWQTARDLVALAPDSPRAKQTRQLLAALERLRISVLEDWQLFDPNAAALR